MGYYFESYQTGASVFCDQSVGCEFEDSLSRIACREITIVDCAGSGPCDLAIVNNGLLLCDCEDSVNCYRCANDRPYWNPVNKGDELFFQFQQLDKVNGQDPAGPFGDWGPADLAFGRIKDCCTDEYLGGNGNPTPITNFAITKFVGVFPVRDYKGEITWKNIQTISINTEGLINSMNDWFGPNWDGCWVFEFCFNNGAPDEYCLCTEPFKENKCGAVKDRSILLEGVYKSEDCFGYYYGSETVGTGTFSYRNEYRVFGSLEQTSFLIEKAFVGTFPKATSSTLSENYQFRTWPIPGRIARLITNILSAKNTFVDDVEYTSEGEVPKNNEEGSQWHIDTVLKRVDCSRTYSCN